MNNMKKLLRKSAYLRQQAEIHMENFDDDMTIEFGDFAHYMGSKISPSTIFNSHFRPQFLGCKGILYRMRIIPYILYNIQGTLRAPKIENKHPKMDLGGRP